MSVVLKCFKGLFLNVMCVFEVVVCYVSFVVVVDELNVIVGVIL